MCLLRPLVATLVAAVLVLGGCSNAIPCDSKDPNYQQCMNLKNGLRQQEDQAQQQLQQEAQKQGQQLAEQARKSLEDAAKQQAQDAANQVKNKITGGQDNQAFQITESPVTLDLTHWTANWVQWYGNTQFAYDCREADYQFTQGLHTGVDFLVKLNTEIHSTVSRDGRVVAVGAVPYDFAAQQSIAVEYGDYVVVYGHITSTTLKPGDLVHRGDVVALSGQDRYGVVHLHLEIVKTTPQWREAWSKLSDDDKANRRGWPGARPGSTRTNPVPFMVPELVTTLKSRGSSGFHPIPEGANRGKWQTEADQPDIEPTSAARQYVVPATVPAPDAKRWGCG